MGQVANTILCSARMAKRYADGLLKDVTPTQFCRLATVGGTTVQSNHPAFVFGHLSLYFPRILAMLGQPALPNAPKFEDLFKDGKPCLDDPDGKTYPPMEAVMGHFTKGYEAAVAALGKASDADLAKQNPNEGRSRELFPTFGDAFNFYLGAHMMSHFGQVSAWRRMMGLGSVM